MSTKGLEEAFDVAPVEIKPVEEIKNPITEDNDYEYARDNLVSFIEKGKTALDDAIRIMQMSEHPRAVEVVSGLLKNISDVNKQLLDLKKMNKEIKEPSKKAGEISQPTQIANQTNNSIFVGTSADLAKLLAPAQDDTVIIEHGKS